MVSTAIAFIAELSFLDSDAMVADVYAILEVMIASFCVMNW